MEQSVVEFLKLLESKAKETNAGTMSVRYFMQDGGEFEIKYKAPKKCTGYGHK